MNKKLGIGILALCGVLTLGGVAAFGGIKNAVKTDAKALRILKIDSSTYDVARESVKTQDGSELSLTYDCYYEGTSDELFKIHHTGGFYFYSPIQSVRNITVEYSCTDTLSVKNCYLDLNIEELANEFPLGESGEKISVPSEQMVHDGYLSFYFETSMEYTDVHIISVTIEYACSYAD